MGDVTEAPEATVKTGKRRHNWAPIKKCWCAGEPVADIAIRYNLAIQSVYQQASRAKWPRRREMEVLQQTPATPLSASIARTTEAALPQILAQQLPAISTEMRNKMRAWFIKTLSATDALHEQLDRKTKRNLDVEEIKSLAGSLELIDRVARRTFGLDSPGSQGSGIAGLAMVAQPWSGSAVIDVTPEPAQLPPALPEAQQTPTVAT